MKYHLPANTWAGSSQTSIGAEPSVVTTRVSKACPGNCLQLRHRDLCLLRGRLTIQFPLAALGSQRMLLEGYSCAVGNTLPPWAIERVVTMDRFCRDSSRESAQQLWVWGVRRALLDLRLTDVRD